MRLLALIMMITSSCLAAPLPVDTETAKPRAKLLGTLTVDQDIQQVLWTPDGSALVLRTGKNVVMVFQREQIMNNETKPKPRAMFELPASFELKIHVPTNTLYGASIPLSISSEARFYSWDMKPILEGTSPKKPDRIVSLDIEQFVNVTLSEDGRRLFVQALEYKTNGSTIWDRHSARASVQVVPHLYRFSTKTGDKIDEAWTMSEEGRNHTHLVHDVAAGQLYMTAHSGEDFLVGARSLDRDKPLWEKKLEGRASNQCKSPEAHFGPEGLLACLYGEQLERPEPRQGPPGRGQQPQMQRAERVNMVLLNSKTGETIHKLSDNDTIFARIHGFSFDGRLFVGELHSAAGGALNVWHTGTGKVLKSWTNRGLIYNSGRGDLENRFLFSPKHQELTTVSVLARNIEGAPIYTPPMHQGSTNWTQLPNVLRTEYTTTIGLWDFSSLVK